MMMKGRAAVAAVAVVVSAWGLFAAPAHADGEPTTTPTMTAPADGSNVSGDVQVSATSVEQQVQFYENGVASGAPVATSGGVAAITWSTWGDANGGPVVWTAADCNLVGCNATQSTGVSVSVLNDPPSITSPVDGSTVGPLPTFAATVGGGALAFTLDGNVLGVDATPPYEMAAGSPLADGAHSMWVTECDAAGATCNGPTATTNFTVATPVLHPAITAVTPNPFSPRVDGRNDTTSFRVHLLDAENVTWSIRNALDQTVNGPHNAGSLGAGDHVLKWNGRNNANGIVGDGAFTIVVSTSAVSGGLTLHGSATAPVRVDDTASVMRFAGGNGATFYPVPDGYLDNFGPKVTVNEGGTLWLQILNTRGTLLRQIAKPHAAGGTEQVVWNGRNSANVLVLAGTYRYRFLAQDAAGNRSVTGLGTVYVSRRHLVTKSVTLGHAGNPATVYGSDQLPYCTGFSYAASDFTNGVWLANQCDPNVRGWQAIWATYRFTLPAAIRYNTVRLQSYGNTIHAPEIIDGLFWNVPLGEWDVLGRSSLAANHVNYTSVFGTAPAAGKVNGARQIVVGVGVSNESGFADYDLRNVTIVVSYSVLS